MMIVSTVGSAISQMRIQTFIRPVRAVKMTITELVFQKELVREAWAGNIILWYFLLVFTLILIASVWTLVDTVTYSFLLYTIGSILTHP